MKKFLHHIRYLLFFLVAGLSLQCQEKGTFNPVGPPVRNMVIDQLTATPNRVSAGGGESTITGRIIDQDEDPYVGLRVTFQALRGTIDASDSTDQNGGFSTRYLSGDTPGTDTITVFAENEAASVAITLTGSSADLTMQLSNLSVLANGLDTTLVTALIVGRSGPLNRIPVRFETTAGSFTGQRITFGQTDIDGRASAIITSSSSNSTVVATITATIEDVATIVPSGDGDVTVTGPSLSSRLKRLFRISSSDAEASIPITFRGVGISVVATPELIPGDGQATSEIRAFVKEDNNQAVPNARVTFSARLGSIPVQAVTDGAGVVRVSLTSPALPGTTDRIVARYGPVLADSVEVSYASAVGRIVLNAEAPSFLANGTNAIAITAQVFGGTGSPAPNVEVVFSADTGFVFPQSAITDADGKAVTNLTSPGSVNDLLITVHGEVAGIAVGPGDASPQSLLTVTKTLPHDDKKTLITNQSSQSDLFSGSRASTTPGRANLSANANPSVPPSISAPGDLLAIESQVTVRARGVQIRLAADPDSLVAKAGSISALSVRVFETISGNPIVGDTVRFATTLGLVPGSAILDADGIARASFTADDEVGSAVVTARYGSSHRSEVTLELLPIIGFLTLQTDRPSIRSGGIDSARVTAQLLDPLGNSAPNIAILFRSDHRPGVVVRRFTDDDGLATFTVESPAFELDSAFRVTATAGEISEVLRIGVRSITRIVTAEPDSLSSGSTRPVTVTYQSFESGTRRPVVGDTVWFSAVGGVVQPFAVLNAEGVAQTSFRVGRDPGTAAAIGQLGALKPDTTLLELVEPVNNVATRVGRRSILANGIDTTMVTALVTNILGQPAPLVWVSFRANSGTLTPEAVLTDTLGIAKVQFQSSAGSIDRQAEIMVTAYQEAVVQENPIEVTSPKAAKPRSFRSFRGIPALADEPNRDASDGSTSLPAIAPNQSNRLSSFSTPSPLLPEFPRIADVFDTITVETRGVNLSLRVSVNSIRADGRSRAGIDIQLTESTTGSAIAGARLRIGATRGAIAAEGITRNDGTYTDSLTVGVVPGLSVVRATYGEQLLAIDTLLFTPDPARQNLIFQLDPAEAIAGSEQRTRLISRVIDGDGVPSPEIGVVFTLEGALWVLVDPSENREITRYENTFRVNDREGITSIRLLMQLRGVESAQTQIFLNRTLLDRVALPEGDLWGDYTLSLPIDRLLDGVNRFEIVGGNIGGVPDRFSVAGVRLGLMGSHVLGEGLTDANGLVEEEWTVGPVAGTVTFKAALADAPARSVQRNLRLDPGDPDQIRLSTAADTLLANGAEESALLALVTDANGNPATSGIRIAFATENGRIRPAEAQTLGDGTASAIYTSSASDRDVVAEVTGSGGGADGSWELLLRGARLRLTVPDARMLADGNSEMEIRARLSTADGAAVSGRRIDFITTRGSITPSAQTGADGVAIAVLTAADVADTAGITATFGPEISDSATVIFASLIDNIDLTSDLASIRADGLDSTLFTVTATDGLGRGASGVRIDLTVDSGRLSPRRVITDGNGVATAKVFGTAITEDDSLRLIATTSGGTNRDTLYIGLRGVTLTVRSERDSLAANGIATARVSARAVETSSGNAVSEGRVSFSTDLGGITSAANLDDNGVAIATYTASPTIGLAAVRAAFGNTLTASDTIVLVDRVAALDFSATPQLILANGSETSTLIVRVTDSWGEGAPQEQVTINFEGSGSVSPNMGTTNADGEFRAEARGTASTADGRLLVTASIRGGRFTETLPIELRGVTLELTANPILIAGDGRSVSTMTALLRETSTGHPVTDDTVRFRTSSGTITPFAITDQNGEAVASLRSEARPAIATIIAEYANRHADTVQVAFAGRYSYLDLRLERASLLADGIDSTVATATLLDTLRRPVLGTAIYFSLLDTLGGISTDSAITDDDGTSEIICRGSASVNDVSGRLRASAGALADTVTFALRGVTMTLSADQDTIPANGVALSRLTAQVHETTRGNPVVNRPVTFRTDAGVIAAQNDLDQNGETSVTLRAAAQPGSAIVTAGFGRGLIAQRRVVFTPTVGSLSLSIGRARILGDGVDTTLIRARLLDGINNPSPNVRITFEAPAGGEISPSQVVTDDNGIAVATYRSFATTVDSVLQLEGVATGGAAAQVALRVVGLTMQLTADPDHLSANGRATSDISATLFETVRHTPLVGSRIAFSSDRGRVSESAVTNDQGIAIATFTAPSVVGNATIIAEFGDTLSTTLSIPCLASVPQTAELSIDPTSLSISGVGRDENALLTVIIRDATGQIVADNNEIVLRTSPRGGALFENDLETIALRTSEGTVEANVRAGETPGTVRFQVYHQGTLIATGGDLTIRSGPPARIRVRPDLSTIHFPAGGFTAFPVSATVSDRFGNPVEDGTLVRFSLTPDTIASISAEGRTAGGIVSTPLNPINYPVGVWLTYGNDVAGEEVYIRAISGDNIRDSARVILPGALEGGEPVRLEAGYDSLSLEANGQSTSLLTINLIDDEARPVADMTEVTLTSTLGIIQSPRYTAGGVATATLRAGRATGIDTVTIRSGDITDMITMRFRPGAPERLTIVATRDHLRADSSDNTTISATVLDRFDNPIQPGTQVLFTTTLGSIEADAATNENGLTRVLLTSGNQAGTAIVRAVAGDADAVTNVVFESGDATNVIYISSDRQSIGIRGSGQSETATLRFQVRDDRGVAIDSLHKAYVRFTLNGPARVVDPDSSSADSVATLLPDSVLTDALGQASVTLHSGYFSGAVEVTGRVGNGVAGRAIAVAITGGPPDAAHFAITSVRCVTTGIDGTPTDTTTLNVTLGDRFSNPVTPGTVVRFRSTGGVIEGSAVTDTLGLAQALLITTRPWPEGGVDTIVAQTVDYQNREILATTTLLVTGPTAAQFDTTDGWVIPFGGYRDFTLTVADRYLHSLSAGTEVTIVATAFDVRGNPLAGIVLTGPGTVDPIILAECDLQTEFSVRLFNYISGLENIDLTVSATITSPNGNREVTTRGDGAAQVLSTESCRVVISPPENVADGADACLMRLTLYDTLGIAIQNVPPDNIAISGVGGDVVVTPPANVTDQFGRTTASLIGRQVGNARIETRINGQLIDDQPILALVAGVPAVLSAQLLNRRLEVGGDTTTVIIDVSDANGNPAADGTSVTFEVDDGTLSPASTTTVNGRATSVLSSGITAGTVEITVRASRRGVIITGVISNVQYTAGPPSEVMVTAPTFSVLVGSQSTITISAIDEFGNAVPGGVSFDLAIVPEGNGQIAPASVNTDTLGVATATFTSGTVAGAQARITATSGDVSGQSSQFTFNPGTPGRLTLEANPESQEVGGDIDLIVTVEDSYGNPVSDTTRVVFTQDPAGGVLSPSAIRTSGGVARSVLTGVTEAGDVEVLAVSSDVSASALVTFTVGPLDEVAVSSQPSVVLVGTSSTITATASDQFGNPISGLNLNFQITTNPGGNCVLQNAERRTAGDGTASTIFTAGQTIGSAIIIVYSDNNGNDQLDEEDEINGSTFVDIGQQQ